MFTALWSIWNTLHCSSKPRPQGAAVYKTNSTWIGSGLKWRYKISQFVHSESIHPTIAKELSRAAAAVALVVHQIQWVPTFQTRASNCGCVQIWYSRDNGLSPPCIAENLSQSLIQWPLGVNSEVLSRELICKIIQWEMSLEAGGVGLCTVLWMLDKFVLQFLQLHRN